MFQCKFCGKEDNLLNFNVDGYKIDNICPLCYDNLLKLINPVLSQSEKSQFIMWANQVYQICSLSQEEKNSMEHFIEIAITPHTSSQNISQPAVYNQQTDNSYHTQQNNTPHQGYASNQVEQPMGSLRCPECGSKNYQLVNNTQTQTTGSNFSVCRSCLGYFLLGPLGLLCGACGSGQKTTTTVTTEYICNNCGTRFKNPQDLKRRIDNYDTEVMTKLIVSNVFISLFSLILIFAISDETEFNIFMIFTLIFGLIIADYLGVKINKDHKTKLENQLNDLQAKMNRFEQ